MVVSAGRLFVEAVRHGILAEVFDTALQVVYQQLGHVVAEAVADEHTLVKKNDIVAYVYSLEYSEKKLQELNRTRKNIQDYHKVVLGKELDSQLEVYDLNVKQKALELKSLVLRTTHGNLLKLIDQLTDAMEQRRQYMSANMRSDAKLIKYYDDETQKLNSIESWRTARTADRDGVVSFYMDGYESALSVDRLEELSVADMRAVLAGESLDGSASRTVTPIYRIVDQNKWYLSVLSADGSWNPVIGTLYNFQLEGYEDLVYSGTVIRVQKTGSTVMAQLEVTDPIGPLIYQRAGNVVLGTNLSGLLVPSRAVSQMNGQSGVWLYDVPGGTFVPVEVLSTDGDIALIQATVDGVLQPGQRVLIIDDFMKGGGTLQGMVEMMAEFQAEVVGIGVMIATMTPETKRCAGAKALLMFRSADRESGACEVVPSADFSE